MMENATLNDVGMIKPKSFFMIPAPNHIEFPKPAIIHVKIEIPSMFFAKRALYI